MKYIPLFAFLFVTVGCSKPQLPPKSEGDYALRAFFNIRTLSGTYQIPDKDKFYEIIILQFENGKMISQGMELSGSTEHIATRELQPQLLFEANGIKGRILLSDWGSTGRSESTFWAQLDGGWSSCEPEKYQDFTILGFAQSNMQSNGNVENIGYGEFKDALRQKRYVGALAVRSFPTRQTEQGAAANP
jgi:hypothetical protein